MASTARIDELKKKFDENPRRYFAPLANEFRKAGDIEQAIMICEEFLPQQPGHMSGHIVYGQALFEAGRLPESRTVFETALALDPENLIALRHLGDIAHNQSDDAAARSWYLRVLDADPRNEEIQALIAHLTPEAPAAMAAPEPPPVEDETPFAGLLDEPPAANASEPVRHTPQGEIPTLEIPQVSFTPASGLPPVPHVPPPGATPTATFDSIDLDFQTTAEHGAQFGDPSVLGDDFMGEFAPPADGGTPIEGLDDSHGSPASSFAPPEMPIAALEGLEGSGGVTHEEMHEARASVSMDALPDLDLDTGTTTPVHGDVLEPSAARAYPTPRDSDTVPLEEAFTPLDFGEPSHVDATYEEVTPEMLAVEAEFVETPLAFEEPVAGIEEPVAEDHEPLAEIEAPVAEFEVAAAAEEMPLELPPEVIAAEAELTDAPLREYAVDAPSGTAETFADDAPAQAAPFVTETMAELYLAQGFRGEALSVYQQLLSANPSDDRLEGIVATLSAPAAHTTAGGPTVRDFFSRLAARRPGDRAAAGAPPSDGDFAVAPSEPATEVYADERPSQDPSTAPTPLTNPRVQTPAGSIDALFGNQPAARADDSAAAALAQAFGGTSAEDPTPPPLTGRPAHAAAGELTLDSVFRDAPARSQRPSQNFSFDQFFAGGNAPAERSSATPTPRSSPEAVAPPDAPAAERSEEDIEQFNSWLQGLKPR